MAYPLQTLLDVRRRAEETAERALAEAIAAVAREADQQARLAAAAESADAFARAERQRHRGVPPARAGDAQATAAYLRGLDARTAACAQIARAHREGDLRRARDEESAARARHVSARQEREVVARHKEGVLRGQAEERDRRAEDQASDLAIAAHARATSRKT